MVEWGGSGWRRGGWGSAQSLLSALGQVPPLHLHPHGRPARWGLEQASFQEEICGPEIEVEVMGLR